MTTNQRVERPLPHNEQAEKFVIGSVFLDNKLIWQVTDVLRPEDFYFRPHRIIYEAFLVLIQQGITVFSPVTIIEVLRKNGNLEQIGGIQELANIIDSIRQGLPFTTNITYYARLIRERSIDRQKIKLNSKITTALLAGDESAAQAAEKELQDLSLLADEQGLIHTSAYSVGVLEAIHLASKNPSAITGVATGFLHLDKMTSGLQPENLIVVAARPSVGKSAFCINLAQYAAVEHQKIVGVFSLEMSKAEINQRMYASAARVELHKIRTGFLNSNEWARIIYAQEEIDAAKIHIDDTGSNNVLKMRTRARKLLMKYGRLDLIIIDYLQLMEGIKRSGSRQEEVSQISRDLKMLAKELGCPIVALSQLSRAPENRTNHRPQLSDLRESGAIEQDADLVGFLYREEMHNATDENKGMAELILAKQRNGDTGTVPLVYLRHFTRFESLLGV